MENNLREQFISTRPRVFGWLGFQRALLWLFCINGIVAFVVFLFKLGMGILKMLLIENASKEIATELHREDMQDRIQSVLIDELKPLQIELLVYPFSICLMFFILARYCQKVINRNKYILELERMVKGEL